VKILVVDDEPIIVDTLVNILTGEGHDALGVSDGKSATRWAEMVRPDAIVTDVLMPGMDGIETAKAIMKLLPNCRIILFSGQAGSTDFWPRHRLKALRLKCWPSPSTLTFFWKCSTPLKARHDHSCFPAATL
jgi:CheY-like chemotaxis protein